MYTYTLLVNRLLPAPTQSSLEPSNDEEVDSSYRNVSCHLRSYYIIMYILAEWTVSFPRMYAAYTCLLYTSDAADE